MLPAKNAGQAPVMFVGLSWLTPVSPRGRQPVLTVPEVHALVDGAKAQSRLVEWNESFLNVKR